MRIHHLLLTSRFAGSERYAIELANAQAQQGHEVVLVLRKAALQDRPDAPARHVAANVRIAVVPNWLASWHARRLIKRERPDVAHAHLSAACKALKGVDGVVRVATLHIQYKPRQHAALDGLVAITPSQLVDLPDALRGHSVHIDNWTHPAAVEPSARQRLRDLLGLPENAVLLGTLGRVEPSKGHELLLRAFAEAKLDAHVQLVIVGAGSALQALRRTAPPRVHFIGFSEEPRSWLAAMDGFVSAAHREPFGLVFLEAMQAGLPILATATEGGRHLGPLFGRTLVPLDDGAALAEALHAFVHSGLAACSYPMERFRLAAKLPEFDALYRRLGAP